VEGRLAWKNQEGRYPEDMGFEFPPKLSVQLHVCQVSFLYVERPLRRPQFHIPISMFG